ncbi:MAG TPA: gamma-glutamylcyclotransferase family protein [Thermoleophilaceae bacterium]|nr:gamma-glutamylcyclotransferase family protein [Thermoleophilaceae bacterium]
MSQADLVFGYGSLAHDLLVEPAVGRLYGYRRTFGVAADNSLAIPGYKRFRSPVDGSFPDVYVAFLDLLDDPAGVVNGVLAAVDPATLADLDRRERNYDRVEVTSAIDSAPAGRVWAYIGSPDGRDRFQAGKAAGSLVVQRAYLDRVHDAFCRLGEAEHDHFLATSDLDGIPVADLERVDLPPDDSAP